MDKLKFKLKASIIIPTYNRKSSLMETLRSLDGQNFPKDQFEVLVVDDGSVDDTADVLGEEFRFRLSYIYQQNHGAAIARNRGAAEARGETLVFLDDDILVEPGFVQEMAETTNEHTVVVGLLYPALSDEPTVFEKIHCEMLRTHIKMVGNGERIQFTECLSGIFSVNRNLFFAVGEMQDVAGDGRVAWGDVDFGYRAWKHGCDFWRSYKAVGYHYDFSVRDFKGYCKRWEAAARTAVKLIDKFPEVESYLTMFDDKRPIVWGKDSLRMVVRKGLRRLTAGRLAVWGMEGVARWIEGGLSRSAYGYARKYVRSLRALYQWVLGAYIYRGYRDGMKDSKIRIAELEMVGKQE